jgi:hypothetical protein
MGKRSFALTSAANDEDEAVPKFRFKTTNQTFDSPHQQPPRAGGCAVPTTTSNAMPPLPRGLVTPFPSVPGSGPFSGAHLPSTLAVGGDSQSQHLFLSAADFSALERQRELAAQFFAPSAEQSPADSNQAFRSNCTLSRRSNELKQAAAATQPNRVLQSGCIIEAGHVQQSADHLKTDLPRSGALVLNSPCTARPRHKLVRSEFGAAPLPPTECCKVPMPPPLKRRLFSLPDSAKPSFSLQAQRAVLAMKEALQIFADDSEKTRSMFVTTLGNTQERNSNDMAAMQVRHHQFMAGEKEKERSALVTIVERNNDVVSNIVGQFIGVLSTNCQRPAAGDEASHESDTEMCDVECNDEVVSNILGQVVIPVLAPNCRRPAAGDEASYESDTEMNDS